MTPDPEPQKRIYTKRVTTVADARDMSESVAALVSEWEELIAWISHRVSHRRASAASRPDKTAHKPSATVATLL